MAPWLASNESRYGALAASSQVERLTESYESMSQRSGWQPSPRGSGVSAMPLCRRSGGRSTGGAGRLLVALPVATADRRVAVVRRPGVLRSRAAGLLAAPWLLGLATLIGIVLLDAWPAALYPRYVNPMLPPFALFAAWAWVEARMSARSLLALAATSSFVAGLSWVYMAGAYYFTHVGATSGSTLPHPHSESHRRSQRTGTTGSDRTQSPAGSCGIDGPWRTAQRDLIANDLIPAWQLLDVRSELIATPYVGVDPLWGTPDCPRNRSTPNAPTSRTINERRMAQILTVGSRMRSLPSHADVWQALVLRYASTCAGGQDRGLRKGRGDQASLSRSRWLGFSDHHRRARQGR